MGARDSEDLEVKHAPSPVCVLRSNTARWWRTRAIPRRRPREQGELRLRVLLLPACDAVVLAGTAIVVGSGTSAAYAVLAFAVLHINGRHKLRICLRVCDELAVLAASALVPVLLLLPWLRSMAQVRQLVLVVATIGVLLVAVRAVVYGVLRAAHRAGRLTDATLIVGTARTACEVGDLLLRHKELGLHPLGFVGDSAPAGCTSIPVLGDVAATPDLIKEYRVRRLIVAATVGHGADLVSMLRAGCPPGVAIYLVPPLHELGQDVPPGSRDEVWGVPLTPVRHCGLRPAQRLIKRGFDIVVTCALLIVIAPVLLMLLVAEVFACGRPVIFRQDRVTYRGQVMKIMKFRTLRCCVHPDSQWSVDPADCSPFGHWLRATHLDELPQLFNVIRGEMSLVGPRPERPFFTTSFAGKIPHYEDRHRAKAGVTGWAQVHGLTGDTSIAERVRFDNYYIEHWSLWLDISILMRTLAEPVAGAVRIHRASRESTHAAGDETP